MNSTSRLTTAIDAARAAGRFLIDNLGKVRSIVDKGDGGKNVVTEIDRGSEEMIIAAVRAKFPDDEILAEESGKGRPGASGFRWVIDPLDGTTNYTHAFGVFCVSIGIERDGKIVAGVIYDPNLDEMFTAELGRGASLNGAPIRVSAIGTMKRSLMVTGFPYNISENPDHAVERFVGVLMKAQAVRRMGSAAIDLAYVACGRYEGFWEAGLHPWDTAAGIILVMEAGGTVTDFGGGPCSIYNTTIAASNGAVHRELLETIRIG
ncbi:MAG TPA: inositol monophosphatase family protein [Bacteroidota bacterium]|nr:inositol monophosphatase family protein [Bacteroidota bacterium]